MNIKKDLTKILNDCVKGLLVDAKIVGKDEELRYFAEAIAVDVHLALKTGYMDLQPEFGAQLLLLAHIYHIKMTKKAMARLLDTLSQIFRVVSRIVA